MDEAYEPFAQFNKPCLVSELLIVFVFLWLTRMLPPRPLPLHQ